MLLLALLVPARAAETTVSTLEALRAAVEVAAPGDILTLAPGEYTLGSTLLLAAEGTAEAPIVLRGAGARVTSTATEAIKVAGPHWHIEGLTLVGACTSDDACEHALHIVGQADGTWVRGMTLVDFNAQIKGNGEVVDGVRVFPNDVRIEGNDLHDTRPRATANPVTKIDVVGGRRWVVEANRISDFQKAGGDTVSYAAFLKGNSRDGTFARNLVVCSEAFDGGVRVGLSLGGGGTDPSYCEDSDCTTEHQGGALRNNLVARCSDVGIYLNKAAGTVVEANTLYATAGIDVRFSTSDARLANNVLDGRIRERDGGTASLGTNLTQADLGALFADPDALDFTLVDAAALVDRGDALPTVTEDYCGLTRAGALDLGALEYASPLPCDTRVTHPRTEEDLDTGGYDSGGNDTAVQDTSAQDTEDGASGASGVDEAEGCGCASAPRLGRGWAWGGALVLAYARRRRRPRG